MNKKLLAAALAGSIAASSAAFAFEFDPKFYIGAGATWTNPKYEELTSKNAKPANAVAHNDKSSAKKNKFGGSLFVGLKFHEYFGLEGGYDFFKKSDTENIRKKKVETKLNNFYVDLLGFMCASNEIDFLVSLGVGRLKASPSIKDEIITLPKDYNKAKWKMRAGIGAQYKFDDNLAARLMVRYQKGNKDFIKHNTSVGLSLLWNFTS